MAVGLDSSFVEIVEINGNEAVDLHVDVVAQAMTETTAILADDGDKNKCPRCSGKVFEAEKMTSNRSVFHKKCFNCQDCHRALDPSLVNDGHEDGLIYCTNCYQKRYGPTVRVFDEDDGRRSGQLFVKPVDPSIKGCSRCQGAVYINEEFVTNGRSYHRQCAKCNNCNRQLDISTLHDAPDKEIYCSGCYGRKFSSAGYRGILSNVWTDEEACNSKIVISQSKQQQILTTTSTTSEMAKIDVSAPPCIRCNSKVYEAEKMVSHFGVYHKACHNCHDCQATLDSVSKVYELSITKEIYCKNCYNQHRGLAGYGYGLTTSSEATVKPEYHYTQFY